VDILAIKECCTCIVLRHTYELQHLYNSTELLPLKVQEIQINQCSDTTLERSVHKGSLGSISKFTTFQ